VISAEGISNRAKSDLSILFSRCSIADGTPTDRGIRAPTPEETRGTGKKRLDGQVIHARREIIVVEMAEVLLFTVPYGVLADVVLGVHLLWILWVILGALLTRHRPLLAGLHILSLIYGILIEVGPWTCPITLAEQWLEGKAGMTPYTGSFLVHYLEALVYPNVPQSVLVWGAAAVAAFNLGIYGRRFWRNRQPIGPGR
jgi:hypothetical protein